MVVRRLPESSELYHHGIEGQRWGIRRYQNEDGTLTPLGEKRYGTVSGLERAMSKRNKTLKTLGAGTAAAAGIAGVTAGVAAHFTKKSNLAASAANKTYGAAKSLLKADSIKNRNNASNAIAVGVIAATGALAVSNFIAAGGSQELKRVKNIAQGKEHTNYALKEIENEKLSKKD